MALDEQGGIATLALLESTGIQMLAFLAQQAAPLFTRGVEQIAVLRRGSGAGGTFGHHRRPGLAAVGTLDEQRGVTGFALSEPHRIQVVALRTQDGPARRPGFDLGHRTGPLLFLTGVAFDPNGCLLSAAFGALVEERGLTGFTGAQAERIKVLTLHAELSAAARPLLPRHEPKLSRRLRLHRTTQGAGRTMPGVARFALAAVGAGVEQRGPTTVALLDSLRIQSVASGTKDAAPLGICGNRRLDRNRLGRLADRAIFQHPRPLGAALLARNEQRGLAGLTGLQPLRIQMLARRTQNAAAGRLVQRNQIRDPRQLRRLASGAVPLIARTRIPAVAAQ